jgi:hypothetical protein
LVRPLIARCPKSSPIDLLGMPGEESVEPRQRWADVGFGEAR